MARFALVAVVLTSAACAALPTSPSATAAPVVTVTESRKSSTTATKVVAPAPPTREACVRTLELACQPGVSGTTPGCWGDNDWGWVRLTSSGSCPDLDTATLTWTITPADRYIGTWHRSTKVPTAVFARSPWGEVKLEASWPGGGASLTVATAPNGAR